MDSREREVYTWRPQMKNLGNPMHVGGWETRVESLGN
jgi:hypothetical protein